MAIELNHTIVHTRDKRRAASFLSEILGLPEPVAFGPFLGVQTANGVTLDFFETDEVVLTEHYAFLVAEAEFDQIFERIRARDLAWWGDPGRTRRGEINTRDGGL